MGAFGLVTAPALAEEGAKSLLLVQEGRYNFEVRLETSVWPVLMLLHCYRVGLELIEIR